MAMLNSFASMLIQRHVDYRIRSGQRTRLGRAPMQPNPSPLGLGQLDTGPRCDGTTFPCDSFDLTVTLPAGYTGTNCNAAVKVTLSWVDTGTGQSDYDLYIYEGVRRQFRRQYAPLTSSLQRADTVPKSQLSLPSRTEQHITRSRSYLSNPLARQ